MTLPVKTEMKIRESVLPVLRPQGGQEEIEAVRECIESGWWGKGPRVAQFEKEFAAMVGARFAVAVNSASMGQDLVLKALGIENCDVINPAVSFLTTGIVPLWNRCTSNIVDVRPHDMNIDPEDVKRSLRPNTRAVIAVNNTGVPAPIAEIRQFFDGVILEDCAHSCYTPGAGRQGDVAVWSFHAVKTLAGGDGGMITTDDEQLYNKLLPMTWMGISSTYSRMQNGKGETGPARYHWDYQVEELGYKCHMNDLTAAICLEQMKKLPQTLEWRRHIQERYNESLGDLIQIPARSETVQHYCARVNARERDALIDFLADKKISTGVHYKPLYLYPLLKQGRKYPVANREWKRLITLPCHSAMTEEDIDYVIYWVREKLQN